MKINAMDLNSSHVGCTVKGVWLKDLNERITWNSIHTIDKVEVVGREVKVEVLHKQTTVSYTWTSNYDIELENPNPQTVVTSEELFRVADWLEGRLVGDSSFPEALRTSAKNLEVENKRLDDYARIFVRGAGSYLDYDKMLEEDVDYYRNGIRAVYEHMKKGVESEVVASDGPRVWKNLEDIPEDVYEVWDNDGDLVRRKGDGWKWDDYEHIAECDDITYKPFTEVLDEDDE